jgi:hypothetical protein
VPYKDVDSLSIAVDQLNDQVAELKAAMAALSDRYRLEDDTLNQHLRDHTMILAQPTDTERVLVARVARLESFIGFPSESKPA